MKRRFRLLWVSSLVLGLVALMAPPAAAVQVPQDRLVSANPADWTPHALDGAVKSIVQVGNRIVVGGNFTQVQAANGGPVLARRNIFAFDATTGAIDTAFVPTVDGEVEALAVAADGASVFIGGSFNNVNGVAWKSIARLSIANGQAVAGFRRTTMNGRARALVLRGGRLYVGGTFSVINGQSRTVLAALDPATGAVDPNVNLTFAGPRGGGTLSVQKLDVTPDGSRLVAIGNFSQVAGQPRHQIVMVDVASVPAVLANWSTTRYEMQCASAFDTYMRDLDFSPDGSYFVVVSTGAYRPPPSLCDTAARWETGATGSALAPTWVDYTGGDTLYSVAVTGSVVYIGGHQRWQNNPFAGDRAGPGAVPREGIAALDPVNGLPFSWNPGRTRGVGVFDMLATPNGLFVGSDTDRIGRWEYHGRLAMFPLAGGTVIPPTGPPTLPNDLYRALLDGNLERRSFDGATAGPPSVVSGPATGIDWSRTRGAFMLRGKVYTGWDDGRFYVRDYSGTTFGPPVEVNLYGLTSAQWPIAQVTGMFFDGGRIYYTVAGDPRLYYRYFTQESNIVGAERFVASGEGDGLSWSTVQGMTLASGRIYYATSDGNLNRIDFAGGRPVPGTAAVVSGPANGILWQSRGLFAFQGPGG